MSKKFHKILYLAVQEYTSIKTITTNFVSYLNILAKFLEILGFKNKKVRIEVL